MIDENRVKLMTRLAIYEKHEKDKSLVMSKYYKTDYVRFNVLKSIVAATVVFWGIVGYYVFMNFDTILMKVSDVDYFDVMYKFLGEYVLFCFIYFLIAEMVYNWRYAKAKDGLIQYNSDLRDLIELEGGPKHYTKVRKVHNSAIENTYDVNEKVANKSNPNREVAAGTEQNRGSVSRMDMLKQRQMQQDAAKAEEIRQNAARLAAQAQAQAQAKEQKERQAAADRQKIQERRKQLEREQMERLRREQQQQMIRENHMYNQQNPYAGNAVNNSGNINRMNNAYGNNMNNQYGNTMNSNGNFEGRNS